MSFKSLGLASAFILSLSSAAVYADDAPIQDDQGSGRVDFSGKIINAPCSIEANNGRPVDLGSISITELKERGRSSNTPFYINLKNCDVSAAGKTVSITFTGSGAYTPSETAKDVLGVTPNLNVGIVLNNANGQIVTLAQPLSVREIGKGDQNLLFGAYVVPTLKSATGGETSDPLAGEFTSTVNFTLAYQ